jgi:hypothetical protein
MLLFARALTRTSKWLGIRGKFTRAVQHYNRADALKRAAHRNVRHPMNDRTGQLVLELREAAGHIRDRGDVASDYFSNAKDFAARIELVATAVECGGENPLATLRGFIVRKWAKYTWCAPTSDLDDYLSGHPKALELGNSIYAML